MSGSLVQSGLARQPNTVVQGRLFSCWSQIFSVWDLELLPDGGPEGTFQNHHLALGMDEMEVRKGMESRKEMIFAVS